MKWTSCAEPNNTRAIARLIPANTYPREITLRLIVLLVALFAATPALAQGIQQTRGDFEDKFRQLDEVLPDANVYRNASGAPGHEYWQQQADYRIVAELDEDRRRLSAQATITYKNNSPDTLPWIWMQLDQNIFRQDSEYR